MFTFEHTYGCGTITFTVFSSVNRVCKYMQYVGLCNVQCTSCWGMSSCYVVFQSNEGSEMFISEPIFN